MQKQVRVLTEGALMCALVGMLLFLNRQLGGVIEYSLYWIMTFPILIYTVKYGVKHAIGVAFSMLLISVFLSTPTMIFYLFSCIVLGIIYGGGIRKRWPHILLLTATGVVTLFSYIITMVLFAHIFGYNLGDDLAFFLNMFQELQLSIGNVEVFTKVLFIIVFCLTTFLQTICVHMLSMVLLKRLKLYDYRMKSLYDIRLPKMIGYICFSIWILFLYGNVVKLEGTLFSYILGLWMVSTVISIGYGVMTCLLWLLMNKKRKWIVFVVVGVFLPIIQLGIAGIGMIDMCFDIRGKWKRGVLNGSFREL